MKSKLWIVGSMMFLAGAVSVGQAGLATNANWTAGGQADSNAFGLSVASAGDVNGDGFLDVIVGAPKYDGNRGKAYVFLGSASGIQTTTNWTSAGESNNNWFGCSVASAGDVNGDGYDDVLVSAFYYGGLNRGRAYLFLGSASGVQSTTNWVMTGEADTDYFGRSAAGAGDVNGDGYADVIIGAPLHNGAGSQRGKAYVFLGCASGLQTTTNWTSVGEADTDDFGWSVAGAGDVNGDGYADVIVGAYMQDGGGSTRGKAYVFLGSVAGVQTTTNWTTTGENDGDTLGRCVAGAGDVNGDGFSDVIIGADQYAGGGNARGKAYVFLGGTNGVQSTTNWTVVGEASTNRFGFAVNSAGDVNGDGYADVIAGAYRFDGGFDRGKAYVFLGSFGGVQSTTNWAVVGEANTNQFGFSVAGAGDVNGDGYADIIVGADKYDGAGLQRGKAYAFYGGADQLAAAANFTAAGEADNDKFGYRAVDAGDVNGDGFSDLIVGAYQYNAYQGKAYLFLGSATGVQAAASWTYTGQAVTNMFGFAVDSAGDVNGDGYGDVIVGAKWYTSGGLARRGKTYLFLGSSGGLEVSPIWTAIGEESYDNFGNSVAGAGDVNGDGYADVLIGAEGYDNKGKAYLFLGNASGLQTSANWTALGEEFGGYFAVSVSGAGDINGDGYADVIIGAEGYNSYQGKAYVFLGAAAGLGTQTNWMAAGENAADRFGRIVAAAGDVNGDGYADILVNAYAYPANQGRGKAYLFLGSAAGPQTNANWTAVGENDADYFGTGLAGAGDVNDDGYGDVIAGAYSYNSASGKAYVFLGSASGLQTQTNWTAAGESAIDDFGNSVSGAGDVNGDGFADVIIGAPRQDGGGSYRGKVYVYYGNSSSGRLVRARQCQVSGQPIQPWGLSTNAAAVSVRMNATRSSGRSRVKLEVQAAPAGQSFGGPGTITNRTSSWLDTTAAANGVVVTNAVTGLTPGQLYHWRARLLYAGMGASNNAITNSTFPLHSPWRRLQAEASTHDVRVLEPRMAVLGTNGAIVASGETPAAAKGTDFGALTIGDAVVTNTLTVTNGGNQALAISGVSTAGAGSACFHLLNPPAVLAPGTASNIGIAFAPTAAGVQTAAFTIVNNSTGAAYVVKVQGTVGKMNQTIAFPAIADQLVTNPVGLSATASSGLPVSFSVHSGPAQISGGTNLSFTGTGLVGIIADQAGDSNWNAAPSVTNSFNVSTVLAAPQNVSASAGRFADRVSVTWEAVSGATGYQIWRHTTNDSASAARLGNTAQLSYQDTNILAGALYYYWVKATNALAVSGFSVGTNGWRRSVGLTYYADADLDGDGKMDLVLYDPIAGIWGAELSAYGYAMVTALLGGPGYTVVPGDYDGDGKTDPAVYEEATGIWTALLSASGYAAVSATLGGRGYMPVPGDFDGDGKTDPAVYQETTGNWDVLLSSMGYGIVSVNFGGPGYTPIQRDYDGDGKTDPALYQETTGNWYVTLSASGYWLIGVNFGGPGYRPAPGDYDGDGKTDPALYQETTGNWYVTLSASGYWLIGVNFGGPGYRPAPGDFDGDGRTDPAVYQESSGNWYVILSSVGYGLVTANFGGPGYDPVWLDSMAAPVEFRLMDSAAWEQNE